MFFYPFQGCAFAEPEEGCDGLVACGRSHSKRVGVILLDCPMDVAPQTCKNRSTSPRLLTTPVSGGGIEERGYDILT